MSNSLFLKKSVPYFRERMYEGGLKLLFSGKTEYGAGTGSSAKHKPIPYSQLYQCHTLSSCLRKESLE